MWENCDLSYMHHFCLVNLQGIITENKGVWML